MTLTLDRVDLDLRREPLRQPFGFKGGQFTEKWLCRVDLTSEGGVRAAGVGGLAVLWSDREVFTAHTEVGGNLLMAALLEYALQRARGRSFDTPFELLDGLVDEVHAYGRTLIGRDELRRTFTLNALVALDNAAWTLYARAHDLRTFDAMIPAASREPLHHRHARVARVPLVSYATRPEQIAAMLAGGATVLKIKIGAAGTPDEMLGADKARLTEVHRAATAHAGPPPAYYLDANGRYPDRAHLEALLAHAREIGMLTRTILLEEPFPEEADIDVHGLGVRVAADESLHRVEDVRRKARAGYGAVALKPAGKTLSVTLRMVREAEAQGLACFVADSACTPRLLDWNRNVAARLAPLPGMTDGLLEANGAQVYRNWEPMQDAHPCRAATWLRPRDGAFVLDEEFYRGSGGVLAPLEPWR
ncbi:MAG: enolase C-terminal domain-like protein [Trueperaceae bacterium]|nr:enolase C-terminal domain-like protein [Trueperaceae bacterium]